MFWALGLGHSFGKHHVHSCQIHAKQVACLESTGLLLYVNCRWHRQTPSFEAWQEAR